MSKAHQTKGGTLSGKVSGVDVVVKDAGLPSELSQVPSFEEEGSVLPPPPVLTPQEEARLWRKVDRHIMPILTMMYLFSFVDRGNIGNAKLQGLVTQLDLTGSRYNAALSFFFLSYNVGSIPANLVLKKFRPSRVLPTITILWGIVMCLMGLVKNYSQLVAVRVCLGAAETGLASGAFYYLSMWYPRHMIQMRFGIFWSGATLAGAFTGLVAFGISFMSGTAGLLGWSWIFIIEGMATVVVGVVACFVFVDFPDTARFLTPEERAFVVNRMKFDNSTVGEDEHFALRHIWEALLDWQVWALGLLNMAVIMPVDGISYFLPWVFAVLSPRRCADMNGQSSIINGFGFNTTTSQLLTVPPYIVAIVMVMVWSIWSDRIKRRSPFLFSGLLLCLVGFAINITNAPIGVKYFGTYLIVIGGYAAHPAIIAWLTNNLAGHYKRAVGIAFQGIFGNTGGLIASNMFRSQDAPRYITGHGAEMGFVGMGLVLVPIVVFAYTRANMKKEAKMREAEDRGEKYAPEELKRLGDRAPDFRYTL
ncbi:MFS general substrate transporter [Ganoderma sinense ZZ0214-1]|uniref:MFS general substrate transporter n=1 Tax=Ganoderma sinense ZZ0214-1 TaxID=1077348 RepID=A0A2G8S453_9APHY|nr:MFS general substrate transporter [Ganoderma sinense ZZ0214-1]